MKTHHILSHMTSYLLMLKSNRHNDETQDAKTLHCCLAFKGLNIQKIM